MSMKSEDKNISAVEAALGAPAGCELSENTLKIRRNVLVVSVASIATVMAGVKINPTSTIMGLQFTGLTEDLVLKGLLIMLVYLLSHFLWCLYDAFLAWRIRVTGTRLAFVTTGKFADEYSDYPNDPRQSSLYWWWSEQASRIGNLGSKMTEIEGSLKEWEERVRELMVDKASTMNLTNGISQINQVQKSLQEIKSGIKEAGEAFSSQRIPVSLARFDNVFSLLLRSQNLRWLVVEAGMPVLVGGYALALLIHTVSL